MRVEAPTHIFLIFIVTEYRYKIKLLKNWNDELREKTSDAFKRLKAVLEKEVMYFGRTERYLSYVNDIISGIISKWHKISVG